MAKVIGEVDQKIRERVHIEWKIADFFSVAEDRTFYYNSPIFSIGNVLCFLEMFPSRPGYPEFMGLYLGIAELRKYSVIYSFGIKKTDGNIELLVKGTLDGDQIWSEPCNFIKFSDLLKQKAELVPLNVLTITCSLKCEITNITRPMLLHKQKFETITNLDEESLYQDYKKVLLDGQNHDLILKVGEKEFKVHRDILKSRSRVFESMLSHDMKEKNSGIIDVCDCDPKAMELFLLYVYCGKVEKLDESNMLGLYYIADKYEMGSLKEECCDFIKKALSITNICEVIQLALDHNDSGLLEFAREYYENNLLDILYTVEWQSFMKVKPTVANELLIKSVEKLKNRKG